MKSRVHKDGVLLLCCLFCFLFLSMEAYASDVLVKAEKQPANGGTIFIASSNTKPDSETKECTQEGIWRENKTFYLWATPTYGYSSTANWNTSDETGKNVTTNGQSSATVQFTCGFWGVKTINYIVTFTPLPVEYTSVQSSIPVVTWASPSANTTLTFNLKYATSAEVPAKSDNGWTITKTSVANAVADTALSVPVSYILNLATVKHGQNTTSVQATAKGFPNSSNVQETKSINATATVKADLTPTFTVPASYTFLETEPNTSATAVISPTADCPNPYGNLFWSATLTEDVAGAFAVTNVANSGAVTVTFSPTEAGKDYSAKLTLTATWKDAANVSVSYSQTLTLSGKGLSSLPGEIHILKATEEQSSASYAWATAGSTNDVFSISTQSMGKLTAVSSSPLVTPRLSDDQKTLYLTCTAPEQAGEQTAMVTISGQSLTGSKPTVTATLSLTLKRWWSDIMFKANYSNGKAVLTWDKPLYAVRYDILCDNGPLTTISDPAVTSFSCSLNTISYHSFTLQVTNGDGNVYSYDAFVAPDTLRNVLFSAEGSPYFDTLYIAYNTSKPNYCRFYHSYREKFKYATADMLARGVLATGDSVKYSTSYTNSYGITFVSKPKPAYVGKYPIYETTANQLKEGHKDQRGVQGDFSNLNIYETSTDGFLRDNKRTESVTFFYGYHRIRVHRTYSMTATVHQYATKNDNGSYSAGERKFIDFTDVKERVDYIYSLTTGNTDGTSSYQAQQLPTDTRRYITDYPSQQVPGTSEDVAWWQNKVKTNTPANARVPSITYNSAGYKIAYDNNNEHYLEQEWTYTWSVDDYIYVWAALIQEDDGTLHLDNIRNGKTYKLDNTSNPVRDTIQFDADTRTFDGFTPTASQICRERDASVCDTIAQVRHHFLTFGKDTRDYLLLGDYLSSPQYSYFDTTWYTLDSKYNHTGKRYTSSLDNIDPNHTLYYHEFDTDFWQAQPHRISQFRSPQNGQSIEYTTYLDGSGTTNPWVANAVSTTPLQVYATNGTTYHFHHTLNSQKQRVGRIEDKRICVMGTCESLCWAAGDSLGWLQPVNTQVYLYNARLQTAVDNAVYTLCNEIIDLNNASGAEIYRTVPYSSSVFYLPSGNTSIHLLGNNYLAGAMAKVFHFKLTVTTTQLGREVKRTIQLYKPNYNAPIAMQDAHRFPNGVQAPMCCTIDAVWADKQVHDGYLDLSTRVCQHPDSTSTSPNRYTPVANDVAKTAYVCWTNYRGYRYEVPLYAGGEKGTFIINGGRVNLWPANGQTSNVEYQNLLGAGTAGGLVSRQLSICAGKSANYMVCGASSWELVCDQACFDGSGVSNISPSQGSSASDILRQIKKLNPAPRAGVYGLGDGYPLGKLIVNGGTVTARTDTNSFAYRWTDYDATTKTTIACTAKNVADDGSMQPLFAPNVQINGGTFFTPVYGTTSAGHGTGTGKPASGAWNKEGITDYNASDYKVQNKKSQSVSRYPVEMPAACTDYTSYRDSAESLSASPLDTTLRAVLANPSLSNEYRYGMNNVWSDKDKLCYLYFPKDEQGNPSGILTRNYLLQEGDQIDEWKLQPYNLTFEPGAEITVSDNYKVYGQPALRSSYTEDYYQALCLPFTANEFFVTDSSDPYFRFYSYVEPRDNANDSERKQINDNAYCYLYYLDDGNGNQSTHGVGDAFRLNYHTHPDGQTMLQGKTYILKFPSMSGDEGYWANNKVTIRGAKGQTLYGADAFPSVERPANDLDFIMAGNPTFAQQTSLLSGEYYVLDPVSFGDDSFHATSLTSLQPLQGYVLGNEQTMQIYRILGRNTTALEQTTDFAWTAQGTDAAICAHSSRQATLSVYTVEGRWVGNYELYPSQLLFISAPQGVYVLRVEDETKKVVVY